MHRTLVTFLLLALASVAFAEDGARSEFTDSRDGRVYRTVEIGGQVWFAENLAYAAKGSFCYGGAAKGCSERLYPKDVAEKSCPVGWRLPSNDDFQKLYGYAGKTGVRSVGNALKAKSGWDRNGNGFDDFGFDAKPAGYCESRKKCEYRDCFLSMWSSTENISWSLYCVDEDFNKGTYSKTAALSVRCIKE